MLSKIFKNRIFLYFGEHGPELDYIVGTTITDLTNLKNSASNTQLSPATITKIIVGWNYLDAIFNFMFATSLFADTTDYRYRYNVVKGIINVFEGIELFVFSYNPPLNSALNLEGGIALAGTAFALGMVADVVCASLDFHKIYRESCFPTWLEEQLKAYQYAVAHGFDTKELIKKIRTRCKAHINGNPFVANVISNVLKNQLLTDPENPLSIIDLTHNLDSVETKHKIKDQWMQEQLEEAYKRNRTFLGVKITSMIGMILLAVSGFLENASDNKDSYPILLTFGLALTTFVGCYYSLVNAERLVNQASTMYHRFFPVSKNETNVVELEEIRSELAIQG
ncbi:hypothetical protein Lmor_2764 [Legionella moravica]|uniref:Uncharacterized protein n=1 Tax=Legionella moravica TaxID=39962 RepID=A0A378K1U0_9GAMM|nr:hypothetical protein [Legionella moravica]KTD31157.1 hypothetical protein Lmor_2764 [Legionella moravica]STX63219.1 Uncharacterised protein [Legionella moravica]